MKNPLKQLTKNKKGKLKLNKLFSLYTIKYCNYYAISKLIGNIQPVESKLIWGSRNLKLFPINWDKDRITFSECYELTVINCNKIELTVKHKVPDHYFKDYKVSNILLFVFELNILTNDYFINKLYDKIKLEQEELFYLEKKRQEQIIITQNTLDFINDIN